MKKNMTEKCILAFGMVLRLLYVLFSSIYDRQYDIGAISLDAGHTVSGGHLAYIQTLYENLRLPNVDPTTVYQFHHPPVHHYLCALWMRFMSLFIHDNSVLQESMQVVPFVFSMITLWFLYKILKEFGAEEHSLWISLLIFSVHPALVQLAGSVNNDCVALTFSVLVIYYMLRWLRDMTFRNILLLAIFLGLGISSKQNVAELAFPIGICFLLVLISKYRNGNIELGSGIGVRSRSAVVGRLLMQYVVFGIVSIPLGMWFYIRNLVKYKMSILWVYELPKDSWQYTGNVSFVNRFLWPVPSELIHNLTSFKLGCGYNVWMQIMRTSVLGEWDMSAASKGIKILAVLLMFLGAVLACMSAVCFVRIFVLGDRKGLTESEILSRLFFLIGYVVTMLFYFVFAYKYPFECSMNFRYIAITLPFMVTGIGADRILFQSRIMQTLYMIITVGFGLFSTCMIGVWIVG